MLQFHVDAATCIHCGECAADCPAGIIRLDELPEIVDPSRCYRCLHCYAVCPTGALSILGHDPKDAASLQDALPTAQQMANLVKWRRSTRRYVEENVSPQLIDDLLATACHAPTGVNAQGVMFTVVRDKAFMADLRQEVISRLEGLAAANAMPGGLAGQYLGYTLAAWKADGKDVMLRGAPHLLLTSAPKSVPSPVQDTHIALTTFELLAQAHGLGTLWDGIFMMALSVFPDLVDFLRIPRDHAIGFALLFGKPAVQYHRPAKRGPATVNMLG